MTKNIKVVTMNTLTHSSYNYKTIEAKTVKRNSLLIGQI